MARGVVETESDASGLRADDGAVTQLVELLYKSILRREVDELGLNYFRGEFGKGRSINSIVEEFINSAEFNAWPKFYAYPGHFYSPIVDVSEAREHLRRLGAPSTISELPGIVIDRAEMVREFQELLPYLQDIPFRAEKAGRFRYRFENPSYSWADGSVLHALLRRYKPRRLIEVGSGWSSACSIDTIENFLDSNCEVTFIEPYPALLSELLGQSSVKTNIIEQPVQRVPLAIFDQLKAGDFLVIDSTHVAKTGSDVCHELFQILPRLKSGVLVHFHDVFWPFEYPSAWAVDENRSWNELYTLRAFLYRNQDWRIMLFNDYLAIFENEMLAARAPDLLKNSGGAFWLQKR